MNYIEKLFKQHPFIYLIEESYYAFGTGVCSKLDGSSVLLESRYKRYKEYQSADINRYDAWRVFHQLISEADYVKNKLNQNGQEMVSFRELNFDECQLKELEKQIKEYGDYFRKHNLQDYV